MPVLPKCVHCKLCFVHRQPLRGPSAGKSDRHGHACNTRSVKHYRRNPCVRSSAKANAPSSGAISSTAVVDPAPQSAREAVERGQQCFDRRQYAEALQLFQAALELQPDEDEARAALFNGSCAHARLKQWKAAADGVVRAVNEYSLKLEVAAKVCTLSMTVVAHDLSLVHRP